MTITKLLVILTLLMSLVSSQAHAEQVPYSEHQKFSAWLQTGEFETLLKQTKSTQYPIVIQAGALIGDGVVYRVLLIGKPSKAFQHEMVFGASEKECKQRNKQLVDKGYTLVHHQTVQLMAGKAHQAVWVKNPSGKKKNSK